MSRAARSAPRATPQDHGEERAPASGVRRVARASASVDLEGPGSPPGVRIVASHAPELVDRLVGVDGAPYREGSLAGILRTFAHGGLRGR